jgi:hypothetical protein
MILTKRVDRFLEPVLIVGFHHAGTRLLARFLYDLGVFQAMSRKTHEWKYIQELNTRLLPGWNDPESVRMFQAERISPALFRLQVAFQLLLRGYRGGQPWGHKDPRTCATLPAWLYAFPKASVVHIVRDPFDVLGTLAPAYARFTPEGKVPQESLAYWGEVWIAYTDKVLAWMPKARKSAQVRFEDLCQQPKQELSRVVLALGLEQQVSSVESIDTGIIQSSKVGVYKQWLANRKLDVGQLEQLKPVVSNYRRIFGYGA